MICRYLPVQVYSGLFFFWIPGFFSLVTLTFGLVSLHRFSDEWVQHVCQRSTGILWAIPLSQQLWFCSSWRSNDSAYRAEQGIRAEYVLQSFVLDLIFSLGFAFVSIFVFVVPDVTLTSEFSYNILFTAEMYQHLDSGDFVLGILKLHIFLGLFLVLWAFL